MEKTKKIDQEPLSGDIIRVLKEKKGGIVVKSFNWWSPLRSRVWALVAMLKGYFLFSEFCQLLLPGFFSKKEKLMDRYDAFLCEELKRECHGHYGNYVNLFGHKFGGDKYFKIIELVNNVIILDQYHINQFLKKAPIIIDAGANLGTFSIFAAHLSPQSHVYSFEPVVDTFRLLKSNTKHYSQITCVNSGLGDEISQKNIFVYSQNTGGSVFEDSPYFGKSNGKAGGKTELANVLTIDAFIAEHGIPRVDFIKIDTEGYEARILKGARESIKKWKPVVSMSAYHNLNDKEDLPRVIKEICPDYICEFHKDAEEDFVCYIKDSQG